MTALIFSFLFLAYLIIPGIIFRRVFAFFIPLRRIQWSRTDELSAFVMTLLLPAVGAFLLVHDTHFFSQHPFGFPDSPALKASDYTDILAASYSEKFFYDNRQAIIASVARAGQRQVHFLLWYYAATIVWSLICVYAAHHYGNLRNAKGYFAKGVVFVLEKFALPVISEWHAMFTPFTFKHKPKRRVQVDALSSDGTLYQGEAGIFHPGKDGQLSGFFLKNAKRFMRAEFTEAKKADKTTQKEKFWRQIPGESFYLSADKISNFNFTYFPDEPLNTLAEEKIKTWNVDAPAKVDIQPATTTVEPAKPKAPKAEEQVGGPTPTTPTVDKNFTLCQHCLLRGRPARLPKVTADTPVISRSDGRSYHLYLQLGPRQPYPTLAPNRVYLAHFRYTLDAKNVFNQPVTVLIPISEDKTNTLIEIAEAAADVLAQSLEKGETLASLYRRNADGTLSILPVTPVTPVRRRR